MSPTRRCSQCGRIIGEHLGYPAGPGSTDLICYRCHRLQTGRVLPESLQRAWIGDSSQRSQVWIFRVGASMMLVLTLFIAWRTRNVGHTLIGLAGTLLFFALGLRARRPRSNDDAGPRGTGRVN